MITAYHRPGSLDEALKLLSRRSPVTVPLGGGTVLSHQRGEGIEVVDLQQVLAANGLADRTQLIDLALLVGTDYNPGIRGIGPKKGLKLIKEHPSLERALEAIGETIPDREVVREIFLRAEHTDEYALEWRPPQREKVIEFM